MYDFSGVKVSLLFDGVKAALVSLLHALTLHDTVD